MTTKMDCDIIVESCTPWPVYDKATGYICLTDGTYKRIVARLNDKGEIFLWWRTPGEKREIKLRVEDILKTIL